MNNENDVLTALFDLNSKLKRQHHGPRAHGRHVPPMNHSFIQMPPNDGNHPRFQPMHGRRRALIEISKNEGLTPSTLSELLDIRPSSCTELLNKLENDGMIERKKDDNDSRSTKIYLTDTSKALIEKIEKEKEDSHFRVASFLTEDEQKQFVVLCKKISNGLNENED